MNSVMSQCLILFPVSFLHLSKNRLTAKVATALLSWIFISLHNLSNSSSLNVSVINMPLLTFNSSLSLTSQSRYYFLLHSIQFPQPTGTNNNLSSFGIGTFPPFFLFGIYFLFFINFGYKHITFFSYLLYTFLGVCRFLLSFQRTGRCPFDFAAFSNVAPYVFILV